MIASIIDWLMGRKLQAIMIAVGASVAIGSCVARDLELKRKGADEARRKIERANSHATKIGSDAARKSSTPGVRGTIDPTTRND